MPYGDGFNPPSITLITMALFVLCFCFGMFNLLQYFKLTKYIVNFISAGGRHTLYIFIYHKLFLDYFLCPYVQIENKILRRIIYMTVIIIGPILIEYLFKIIRGKFNEIINNNTCILQ